MEIELRQNMAERVCESIAKFSFLSLIVLATWLGSGTRVEFLIPMFFTAAVTFLFCLFAGLYRKSDGYCNMLSVALVFFSIVCVVAYFNPFAESFYGERSRITRYFDYIKYLPTSVRATFDYGNSLRSLCILSTSLFATMSACLLFKKKNFAIASLAWFAINSATMGAYAMYQKFEKFPAVYGIFHSSADFYGSFFLSNAAGAFLNIGLAAAIACALISASRRCYILTILFVAMALISSFGAWFSNSKAAQILCLAEWGLLAYSTIFILIKRNIDIAIVRAVLVLLITAGMLFASYSAYNAYSAKHQKFDTVSKSFNLRLQIYQKACDAIKEYPIWGVGGECSRFAMTKKLPTSTKKALLIAERPHSDILEYILDYGLLGAIVFVMSGIFFCRELFLKRDVLSLANYCALIGVSICFLHGTFDMELHIPSTMLAFGMMTAWSYAEFKK